MKTRNQACLLALAILLWLLPNPGRAATPQQASDLYARVSPALVAVQYTWAYEFGRIDFALPGIIVRDDGLTMIPLQGIGNAVPDQDHEALLAAHQRVVGGLFFLRFIEIAFGHRSPRVHVPRFSEISGFTP